MTAINLMKPWRGDAGKWVSKQKRDGGKRRRAAAARGSNAARLRVARRPRGGLCKQTGA